jgi:hypothetical protein
MPKMWIAFVKTKAVEEIGFLVEMPVMSAHVLLVVSIDGTQVVDLMCRPWATETRCCLHNNSALQRLLLANAFI